MGRKEGASSAKYTTGNTHVTLTFCTTLLKLSGAMLKANCVIHATSTKLKKIRSLRY